MRIGDGCDDGKGFERRSFLTRAAVAVVGVALGTEAAAKR